MSMESIPLSDPARNGQPFNLPNNRIVNRIFWAVVAAVALIALGSFALSFMALHELGTTNGTPQALGWIWPLIVDVSMVIYTAAILVAQLQRRAARLPIGLTIFYAVVTVTGNILHAPPTPLGWFVAALPPLSLILGTECLRTMAAHMLEQQAVLVTLAALTARYHQTAADLDTMTGQVDTRRAELDRLTRQLEQARIDLDTTQAGQIEDKARLVKLNEARAAKVTDRRAAVLSLLAEGLSPADISTRLAVSARTIKRDIIALNGKVGATL
ncbi:MAG: DUF2637 domain-containing protein [Anaerolineales bacterium]|nr:DUF2637 domain-containing protein [Anaerolineales bacterium]